MNKAEEIAILKEDIQKLKEGMELQDKVIEAYRNYVWLLKLRCP